MKDAGNDVHRKQSASKQAELGINTYHKQQQALLDWFLKSIPGERLHHLIRTLHRSTLQYGLDVLRRHMEALVVLDLKLYHKYACLLSDRQVAEGAYLYAGWCLFPIPTEIPEESICTRLEFLIKRKVAEYDDIVKSVRKWKNEVDDRI